MKKLSLGVLCLMICLNGNYSSFACEVKDNDNDFGFYHVAPEIGLDKFTQDDFDQLKKGLLQKEGKYYQLIEPKVLEQIQPSNWQVLSQVNFLSRIKKEDEKILNDVLPNIEGQYSLAQYTYTNYYGINVQKIQLLCAAGAKVEEFENVKKNLPIKDIESVLQNEFYVKRAISNVFQVASNERLRPSGLKNYLNRALDKKSNGRKLSDVTYFSGSKEEPIFQYFTHNNKIVVVSNPVHDLPIGANPMQAAASGNLPFTEAWTGIKNKFENEASNIRVFMPLAQSNKRAHWTTLILEREKGIWQATHYDSKGFLGNMIYSLKEITNILFEDKINLKNVSTGHQGLFNNNECGYFVITYILNILEGKSITFLNTKELQESFKAIV